MSDHEEKLTAEAKAYIDKMKASLRELGVNLANGVDIQEQARVISNRIAANEAAAQHDLDCAARERDTAQARKRIAESYERLAATGGALVIDKGVRNGERIQDLTRRCADLEAAVSQATAQISAQSAELDRVYAERDHFGAMFAEGSPMRLEAAQRAADVEVLRADVAAVWELWGAGREREPGKLHELCQEQERLSSALESKLRVIAEKLDAATVPTHYWREQKGGPIALPERLDLLIASHDSARALADAWETSSMREAEERMSASDVLDELGAPDHAGSIHLSTAARIRALPGLLRKD